MYKKIRIIIALIIAGNSLALSQQGWQSALVGLQPDGTIIYKPDADGFVIPDFSNAGYKGGGVALPEVDVVKTIAPVEGDNTQHIQAAIDFVGSLPLNSDGIRGALLLTEGTYNIRGSLYVKYDGVILRGVGQNENPQTSTIIYARENTPNQRTVITLGNNNSQVNGTKQLSNTLSYITDEVVPVGSFSFSVSNPSLYRIGDRIVIYHPATQAWTDAVNKGGVPYPDPTAPTDPDERWKAGQLPIIFHRYIKSIDGNKITVDAPVFYSLNKSLSQSYIYKPDMSGLIQNVGIENLRVDIETAGGEDENHAWQAVRFKSCENAWAKNCTFLHFGQSGIITEACYRSSFIQCNAVDPVAIITGERMYNFNTYVYSQLNLFSNCYARNGRHHYVSNGTSSTSGNVFLRCISDAVNSVNEGHRQWTQGMLYDNHMEINLKRDFVLGLYNRVAMGTGHGWAAVHSILWNCDVTSAYGKIGLQKPPTAQNYAIGCFAKSITGSPISASVFEKGYTEGQNLPALQPQSLYDAQLFARKKISSDSNLKVRNSLKVTPTVTENSICIQSVDYESDTIFFIRNMEGKIVNQCRLTGLSNRINVSGLSSGLYLLECIKENNYSSTRFIKK